MKIILEIDRAKPLIALALMSLLFSFGVMAQDNPNEPLDGETVGVLLEELAEGLPDLVGNEDQVAAIAEKWEAREDLEGKTRSQIMRLLFADVQVVVKDPATRTKIWRAWNPPSVATAPKPAATPGPKPAAMPTTQPNTAVTTFKAGTVSVSKFPGGPEISFAYIPTGLFKMGANGIQSGETVKISKAFWMQQTEVTQAQWKAVMGPTNFNCFVSESMTKPLEQRFYGDRKPVVCVTWNDAAEFVRQLNLKNDGYHYRLPTGAEWEYAARADSINDKPEDLNSIAWYLDNADGSGTHEVATKKANAWGLFDMLGNAEEWVQECNYTCEIRGGEYAGFGNFLYPAFKRSTGAEYTSNGRGFRIVREAGASSPKPKPVIPNPGPPVGTLSRMVFKPGVESSFAYIPPGEFEMGSLNGVAWDRPAHTVRISKGFWIQTTEVTQAQWMAVMGVEPNKCDYSDSADGTIPAKFRGDLFPVFCVNLENIDGFIRRMNERNDGFTYRLPTEAEWEYAARAGTVGKYSGDIDSLAWPDGAIRQVATKKPNPWGLYDIHGNISEVVKDMLGPYPAAMVTDPLSTKGQCRVTRGGSLGEESSRRRCLSSSPLIGSLNDGFRLVRVLR